MASLRPNCRPKSFCWPVCTSEEYNKNISCNTFTYLAKQRTRHLWIKYHFRGHRSPRVYEGNNKHSGDRFITKKLRSIPMTTLNIRRALENPRLVLHISSTLSDLQPIITVTLAFLTTVFATSIFRTGADDAISLAVSH